MKTHLSEVIDITDQKIRYDASAKEALADKQVAARILKGAIPDVFGDDTLEEIMSYISRMGPDGTPLSATMTKVEKTSEVDTTIDGGSIIFDLRFAVNHLKKKRRYLINLEPQLSLNPKKLGYHIENRAIYYICRMISSQKNVEFFGSDYDSIIPAYGIWIAFDAKDGEESIEHIGLTKTTLFGEKKETQSLDKVHVIIIRLRLESKLKKSENELIAMLEELLGFSRPEVKKQRLVEDHGFIMNEEIEGRIDNMCNLSDGIWERGIEEGRAEGRAEGRTEGREEGREEGRAEGREEGRAEGREEGRAEGREEGRAEGIGIGEERGVEKTLVSTIKTLMETMKLDIRQAMDALKIPPGEREKFKNLIL